MHRSLLLLWFFAASAAAASVPGPLVEPEWLAQHAGQVVLLDVRPDAKSFSQPVADSLSGHIPGAVLVAWDGFRAPRREGDNSLEKMLPGPSAFQTLMRRAGVGRDTPVVITSLGASSEDMSTAARLFWTLKYYGHEPVALLNGGTLGWALQRRALVYHATAPQPGDFQAGPGRAELLADTRRVEQAIAEPGTQLVDTRTLEYYLGLEKVPYVAGYGHLPGARLFPHTLTVETGYPARLRSRDELSELAAALGIDPAQPLIVYCNSAALSSIVWFAFHELLGRTDTRMYDGSLHAWTRDAARPLERMRINLHAPPPASPVSAAD